MESKFAFNTTEFISKSETEDYFEVEGLASTSHPDLEEEIIRQNFDLSAIEAGKGVLNDDHGHKYDNKDHARIGVIDEAKITKKGLWIKGKVWKNHPAAVSYYNELKHKPGMVQFSVEGLTLERDPFNKKIVNKAYVTGVALTRNPVNTNTYASFVKSLMEANVRPLFPQESINHENPVIKSSKIEADEKTVTITKVLDASHEEFKTFYEEEIAMLQKGGPGSGRKNQGGSEKVKAPHHEVSSGGEHKVVVAEKHGGEDYEKRHKETQKKNAAKHEEEKPSESHNNELQRKNAIKREIQEAKESGKSPEEKKANVAVVKEKYFRGKKVRKIKKSDLIAELVRRSDNSPEFKELLKAVVEKALSSGGPAYATTLPGDMTGGQVFQQEEIVGATKPKKCKNCKDSNKKCECK